MLIGCSGALLASKFARARSLADYTAELATARRAASCEADCQVTGACASLPGRPCVAISQEDCRASSICRDRGKCSLSLGLCVAGGDEDCRKSRWCSEYGHCSLTIEGCLPGSDKDCAQSAVCTTHNLCKASKLGMCRQR